MATILGMNAKLYYNTGTYGSPTWTLITNVRDVNLSLDSEEADVTTRANSGWKTSVVTLRTAQITFQAIYDKADTASQALFDAYLTGAIKEFAVADAAIATTGTEYFRAECYVKGASVSQPLTDAIKHDFTLVPTSTSNGNPQWVTVS